MGEQSQMRGESDRRHGARVALTRPVTYELIGGDSPSGKGCKGKATVIDLGRGGMLLLINQELAVDVVMKIGMITPIPRVVIPTLVDVRWTRKAPPVIAKGKPLYFVGVRFLLL